MLKPRSMLRAFSIQSFLMGLLVAFAGFASSFAVVLQGLTAVGASAEQATSGLIAASVAMGLCGITLSLWTRMPISAAWSTPGAALLATATIPEGGFPAAVGAFLLCGGLLTLAGVWRPLSRLVKSIPSSLANAMLAGILITLCLAPFRAVAEEPVFGLIILSSWIVGSWWNRFLGVPAALLAFVLIVILGVDIPEGSFANVATLASPDLSWITPSFELSAALGIALPLFIVTMASQNIPGAAVLAAHNYKPEPGPLFAVGGIFSLLCAPFGGHAVNLAAITAAMCASEDAHPDPQRRYWSAIVAGLFYILFGLMVGLMISFVSLAPSILIQAVAGLALIGAFVGASRAAFEENTDRDAAAVTFLATASGMSLFGISGAFWGLIAGTCVLALKKLKR